MEKIVPLTEEYEKRWNDYLNSHKDSTIFHTIEWRNIVQKVYRLSPLYYLALSDGGKVKGILPAFYSKSIIRGKSITSLLGYSYGGPVSDSNIISERLIKRIIEEGKRMEVKYIEFKLPHQLQPSVKENLKLLEENSLSSSILFLSKDYQEINAHYKPKFRKNLKWMQRRFISARLSVCPIGNLTDLKNLYRILLMVNRDKYNFAAQPYQLYLEIFNTLIPKKMAQILVARHKGRIIGGIVLLKFNDLVLYNWGASEPRYNVYSPSTILLDYAIQNACNEGLKIFSLGPSHKNQTSLLFYKSRWGAKHISIPTYYAVLNCKSIKVFDPVNSYKNLRRFIRYIPLSVLKISAPYIYRFLI